MSNKNGFIKDVFSPIYGPEKWEEKIEHFAIMSEWFCTNYNSSEVSRVAHE
jgi:hypothetical protein